MILGRHEHGRPVSRRKNDLQGPKIGGPTPKQRLFGANLYLPSVPLELPLLARRMPGTEIGRIIRRYERCLKSKTAERHTKHYQIAKDPIRGESRANRFHLRPQVLRGRR